MIESPFGMLNATQENGHVIYNHNVIVWEASKSPVSHISSLMRGVNSTSFVELTTLSAIIEASRLIDTSKQIEISFNNIGENTHSATVQ